MPHVYFLLQDMEKLVADCEILCLKWSLLLNYQHVSSHCCAITFVSMNSLLHIKAHCLHLGYRNIPQFLQSNESKTEAVSLGTPLWTMWLTHDLGSLSTLKHRLKILDTNLTRTKILSKPISSKVFCMLLLHVDWTIVMHSILELVNHFLLV